MILANTRHRALQHRIAVAEAYAYWALGHIHARQVLSERPWIVFPGNIQGRHPKEAGARGCTLVTVEDGAVTAVEHRAVDVLRWTTLEVDADGADVVSLTGRIEHPYVRLSKLPTNDRYWPAWC